MVSMSTIQDLLKQAEQPFNVIEEFAALSPKRKILLCDHLFIEGRGTFEKTVKLLWPEASARDARHLEQFLRTLRQNAH